MGFHEIGVAIAALSSFFNGSFPVWQRLSDKADPILFNGIVTFGAFLSSLPVPLATGRPYVFTAFGALGGALFVFAVLFSFLAIPKLGLAISQTVWSTSAILVSFAWGAFGPSQISAPVKSFPLSFIAVALLIGGALIIVRSDAIARCMFGQPAESCGTEYKRQSDEERASSDPSLGTVEADESAATRFIGLVFAAAVGIFGGSILVPFKFIPQEKAGLAAVPSFGCGALIGTAVALFYARGRCQPNVKTLLAGLMSGATWNAGNLCSIIAQSPPLSLSYGIAYPILQCAMLFGGIWDIFVFHEIRGGAIMTFWVGAAILVTGLVLLTLYGPGSAD